MARKPKDTDKDRLDVNELAFRTIQAALGNLPKPLPPGTRTEKSPTAQKRGAKGGRIGGKARAAKLTPEQRAEIAKKAARKRWQKDG